MKKISSINFTPLISHLSSRSGFTLVELLLAIAIFSVIGTVSLSILFMTLRAGKKSDLLIVLKQNGNAAMSQVVKNIRYAKSLDIPTSCVTPVTVSQITLTSIADNGSTEFACTSTAPNTIASNGASLIDTSVAVVTDCSFTCTQPTQNDPPTINFIFKLSSRNATGLVETQASIPFQTSVTMRNYSK